MVMAVETQCDTVIMVWAVLFLAVVVFQWRWQTQQDPTKS